MEALGTMGIIILVAIIGEAINTAFKTNIWAILFSFGFMIVMCGIIYHICVGSAQLVGRLF